MHSLFICECVLGEGVHQGQLRVNCFEGISEKRNHSDAADTFSMVVVPKYSNMVCSVALRTANTARGTKYMSFKEKLKHSTQ
jgi:hypothetical protein